SYDFMSIQYFHSEPQNRTLACAESVIARSRAAAQIQQSDGTIEGSKLIQGSQSLPQGVRLTRCVTRQEVVKEFRITFGNPELLRIVVHCLARRAYGKSAALHPFLAPACTTLRALWAVSGG